ncbi:MAG: acetyl-CoA C-acetyltransferase [Streptosporangiaceae bacterium]|nr:acetyl-CoA C-acetyltransferase [Streptosporangiaceae bacterium]MBV9855274.1 acetyl-CoA C-acetyltransferase [Streptosporangiaceae bacterium]
MPEPVIIGGARTAIGRLLGSLAGYTAAELGGFAIKAALMRAGVAPDQVEYVIMGQVLQAGAGQIPSRQAAVRAGIPMTVPSITINKVCLSGLDAIAQAARLIRLGEYDIVVAGGMESMTGAPHLLPKSRKGFRYGPVEMLDSMALDGLTDPFDHVSMGESTERLGARLGITRAEQDEFAARSQQRAAIATKNGILAEEITPVPVPRRGREPLTFAEDEGVRGDTTVESLAALPPAFAKDGTITAGSASQISDGACAVVVASRDTALALGADVLAEVGAFGTVAGPDNSLHSQPSNAIRRALAKAGQVAADLDLIEINEAFAAVAVQSMRELGAGPERVNVNGGAIALGHPLGASGARIALTLAYELRRRGGGLGAAGLCGGGGQGSALLLRVP